MRPCYFGCGRELDPTVGEGWQQVVGWERKATAASRKTGSDIRLRELRDRYACDRCVAKKRR